jgi:hypothetical protein
MTEFQATWETNSKLEEFKKKKNVGTPKNTDIQMTEFQATWETNSKLEELKKKKKRYSIGTPKSTDIFIYPKNRIRKTRKRQRTIHDPVDEF